MTVQVLKTKAETALGEQFAEAETTLPGGEWLRELRLQGHWRLRSTGIAASSRRGMEVLRPARGDEGSLSACVAPASVIRQPMSSPSTWARASRRTRRSSSTDAPRPSPELFAKKGAGSLAKLSEEPPAWLKAELEAASASFADGAIALNTALFTDGMVLDIPAECRRSRRRSSSPSPMATARPAAKLRPTCATSFASATAPR